jgi:tyrosyl-tRNA synthetase
MDVKMLLAQEVVSGFHGQAAARKASEVFQRVFRDRQAPEEAPVKNVAAGASQMIKALLPTLGLATSVSEAERLVKQGAVEIDGQRIDDPRKEVHLSKGRNFLLRAGKKKFVRVVVA